MSFLWILETSSTVSLNSRTAEQPFFISFLWTAEQQNKKAPFLWTAPFVFWNKSFDSCFAFFWAVLETSSPTCSWNKPSFSWNKKTKTFDSLSGSSKKRAVLQKKSDSKNCLFLKQTILETNKQTFRVFLSGSSFVVLLVLLLLEVFFCSETNHLSGSSFETSSSSSSYLFLKQTILETNKQKVVSC